MLPLKEIRRRLSGLSDDGGEELALANDHRPAAVMSPTSEPPYDESLASAGLPGPAGVSRAVPNGADGAPVSGGSRRWRRPRISRPPEPAPSRGPRRG